jgi:hypothetical protein
MTTSRAVFLVTVLGLFPLLGWFMGVVVIGGTDPEALGLLVLFGLPVVLSVVVGLVARRPPGEVVAAAVVSGVVAGVFLLLTIVTIFS